MPMERPHNPTPINPNANYLSNSISNVLCSLQKLDQGTLGWPTAPRKRYVWTKKMDRSPPEVPLADTAYSLIPTLRHFRSKYSEGVDKKNTLYQILNATLDHGCCEKSGKRREIACKGKFYNEIFDIVRTDIQFTRHRKAEENKPQGCDSPVVRPPEKEIYKVRPRNTETISHQNPSKGKKFKRKAMYSIVESYEHREKPNEQAPDKGKSPKSKSQHYRRDIFQQSPEIDMQLEHPMKGIDKAQTRIIETRIHQDDSKKSAKPQHNSPTAKNSIKQIHKPRNRSTETRPQKEGSKNGCKHHHKSPKPVPDRQHKSTSIKDDTRKNSIFQYKPFKVQHNQYSFKETTKRQEIYRRYITEFSKVHKSPSSRVSFSKTPIVYGFAEESNNVKNIKKPKENVIKKTPIKATVLLQKIKKKSASRTTIRKLRVSKTKSNEKYRKASQNSNHSKQMTEFELIRDGFESNNEFFPPRLYGRERQKQNRRSSDERAPMDIEGIQELREKLYFPYNDIFDKNHLAEVKNKGDKNKKHKSKAKRKQPEKEVRPLEVEKEGKDALKKKSACYMCRGIRCPEKEAPFLNEMRKEQRRQELMAYRAYMAMWNKPSNGSNRAWQLGVNELDKKLYSLEDRYIVFTKERNIITRPEKSNLTILPTPSKSITFLKKSNSFIFPRESSSITCS